MSAISKFEVGLRRLSDDLANAFLNYSGHYLTLWLIESPVAIHGLRELGVPHWAIAFEFSDLEMDGSPKDRTARPKHKAYTNTSSPVLVIEIVGKQLPQMDDFTVRPDKSGKILSCSFWNNKPDRPCSIQMQLLGHFDFDRWAHSEGRTAKVFLSSTFPALKDFFIIMEEKLDIGYQILYNNCQTFVSAVVTEYDNQSGTQLMHTQTSSKVLEKFIVLFLFVGLMVLFFKKS